MDIVSKVFLREGSRVCRMTRTRGSGMWWYKNAVLSVLRLRCQGSEEDLVRVGTQPYCPHWSQGLSLSVTYCFLGVLPSKPVFFSTNNSDLRGFLLVESRELLIIVLPFLPKPQPKLMGPPEIAAVFRRYLNSSSLIPNFSPVVSVRYLAPPPLPFRPLPLGSQAELKGRVGSGPWLSDLIQLLLSRWGQSGTFSWRAVSFSLKLIPPNGEIPNVKFRVSSPNYNILGIVLSPISLLKCLTYCCGCVGHQPWGRTSYTSVHQPDWLIQKPATYGGIQKVLMTVDVEGGHVSFVGTRDQF